MIKDLVSVIIPTFNRAHLIKRSAMSVLNQTYDNLELIIVDDGSTDNTEEIVKSINDTRIIYIKQPNQRACAARNNGIEHAQGEFIAFQDSDDIWHKDKLKRQVEILKTTDADVVFCKMAKNGVLGDVMPKKLLPGFMKSDKLPFGIGTQCLCAYATVFKQEQFDTEMPRFQDFELLLRIRHRFKIYCMADVLVNYYMQSDSITTNADKLMIACDKILSKHKDVSRKVVANLVLNDAFKNKTKLNNNMLFDYAYSIYPHPQVKMKIIAYKIGVWNFFYNLLKKIYLFVKTIAS